MRGSFLSYTFLNPFPEKVSSVAADLMRSGVNPGSAVPVHVVTPPMAGLRFLSATGEEAERLDGWWERHVPADSLPVVVALHEPGLERYLRGLDAEFVIGAVSEMDLARYRGLENVRTLATDSALALTEYAMQAYAVSPARCFRADFPYRAWRLEDVPPGPPPMPAAPATVGAAGLAAATTAGAGSERNAPAARFTPRTLPSVPRAGVPRARRPADASVEPPAGPQPPLTRAQLLRKAGAERASARGSGAEKASRGGAVADSIRAGGSAVPESAARRGLAALLGLAGRRSIDVPREIGDVVLGLRPAPVVAVVSRAGGVGKTAVAAALAQIVGYSIGETTGTAAIVDQNIGNPDQWGRLDIPARSSTVRSLMASLSSGADLPPAPAWANTPALAVYPEDRESAEPYSPGLVQRFVQHLRERHVFTVVDLPNRLPDASSAEGAICAFYLELADLVVMPTTDDPNRLLGVLEYLDAPSLKGKPAIVSYIVSPDRRLRTHPRVVELLNRIRSRVTAVVPVPKSEKATLAIVEGVSILEVSAQLRSAYVQLALAAVRPLAG